MEVVEENSEDPAIAEFRHPSPKTRRRSRRPRLAVHSHQSLQRSPAPASAKIVCIFRKVLLKTEPVTELEQRFVLGSVQAKSRSGWPNLSFADAQCSSTLTSASDVSKAIRTIGFDQDRRLKLFSLYLDDPKSNLRSVCTYRLVASRST